MICDGRSGSFLDFTGPFEFVCGPGAVGRWTEATKRKACPMFNGVNQRSNRIICRGLRASTSILMLESVI